MHLTYVSNVPIIARNKKLNNNKMKELILDFLDSDEYCARIDFTQDEYSSNSSVYAGARYAIRTLNAPVEVLTVQGEIYLRRAD